MKDTYPGWATDKQKEGMEQFEGIASEYGDFEIEFKESVFSDEEVPQFEAHITWGDADSEQGIRKHEFRIGWCYEDTWDRYGDPLEQWQFIFAGGDATREMTTEVFFLDLFFYLDKHAITKPQ